MGKIYDLALRINDRDAQLTDQYLGGTPLHCGFWVGRRLRSAIERAANLHGRGKLLDIGCGMKPYGASFTDRVTSYFGIEHSRRAGYRGHRADLCGDAARLPIADDSVDTVLCTEVLEHVPHPDLVFCEIARVLKPGGLLLLTAPFVFPVHDPHDYLRFTAGGLRDLTRRNHLETVELNVLSYPLMTVSIMLSIILHDLCFLRNRYLYPLSLPIRPIPWLLVALLNFIGWAGEGLCRVENFSFNHLLVARKPATASIDHSR